MTDSDKCCKRYKWDQWDREHWGGRWGAVLYSIQPHIWTETLRATHVDIWQKSVLRQKYKVPGGKNMLGMWPEKQETQWLEQSGEGRVVGGEVWNFVEGAPSQGRESAGHRGPRTPLWELWRFWAKQETIWRLLRMIWFDFYFRTVEFRL